MSACRNGALSFPKVFIVGPRLTGSLQLPSFLRVVTYMFIEGDTSCSVLVRAVKSIARPSGVIIASDCHVPVCSCLGSGLGIVHPRSSLCDIISLPFWKMMMVCPSRDIDDGDSLWPVVFNPGTG